MDRQIRVLHVEDDPSFADLAAEFLERPDDGLTVTTEHDAEDGLAHLSTAEVDCIVSDYDMPGANGVEFLERVREDHPDLPFILFTGKGSEEVAAEAVAAGVSGYIQKRGTETFELLRSRVRNEVEDYRRTTSYRRYRTLVESLSDPLYVTDEAGRITEVNDAFLELTGHDEAAVIGSEPSIVKGDDAVAQSEAHIDRLYESGGPDDVLFEVDIETADGRSIRCENHVGRVPSENGGCQGVVGVLRDVSTRRESEQFRERLYDIASTSELDFEERCRRMLDLGCERLGVSQGRLVRTDQSAGTHETVVAAGDISREGRVADLSRTYCRRVVEAGESVAFHDSEGTDWETDPAVETYGYACYTGAEVVVGGEQYGTVCFFSSQARPSRFSDAELTFVELIGQQIGQELERRHSREDIRERQRTLDEVYDIVSDREQSGEERVRRLLKLGHETLGLDYGAVSRVRDDRYTLEVVEPTNSEHDEGDSLPLSKTACERTIADEETRKTADFGTDERYRDHPVHAELGYGCYIGTPVYRDGELHGTVCFLADAGREESFSDWETTLVELIGQWVGNWLSEDRRRAALARERERLEQFAGIVSHDLRNPLNAARGRVELAQQDHESEDLEKAVDALDRAETLIDDLLTLAREGESVTEFSVVDLGGTVEECWGGIGGPDATLRTTTAGAIRANPTRLRQVIENLFRNAVEHGGESVTVQVGDLGDGDGFYVADDGPGISEERREQVFESRYTTAVDGVGFGLTIVREVVEAHGWQIDVTESESGGARFEIRGVDRVQPPEQTH